MLELKRLRYQYLIHQNRFRSEEKEFQYLEQLISPGDTVVDIGANVGRYTLRMADLVGNGGRVLGFEPITRTFDLLSSNVVFGGFNNVSLFNCAITDRVAEVAFSVPDGNYYQSHLSDDGAWKVMGYPLESFMSSVKNASFLKIDAEGCDEDIVRSARGYINVARPVVMVEISGSALTQLATELKEYRAFALAGSHNGCLVPDESREVLEKIGAVTVGGSSTT